MTSSNRAGERSPSRPGTALEFRKCCKKCCTRVDATISHQAGGRPADARGAAASEGLASTCSSLARCASRSNPFTSPAPATQQAGRRRPTLAMPSYEVPTAKRRDALVTETRQRLRYSEQPPPGTRLLMFQQK